LIKQRFSRCESNKPKRWGWGKGKERGRAGGGGLNDLPL